MREAARPAKLVCIARVRNEADIIEPFVRHHCRQFDKLVVLDDGSTDHTLEMLHALRALGLPLVVLQESALSYEQSRYMSRLLHMAVEQFGADWVVPLDADEFVETNEGVTLREALSRRPPELLSVFWSNFAWSPECDGDPEKNPVKRLHERLPPRSDFAKVIVPARFVGEGSRLAQGNHGLLVGGQALEPVPLSGVRLCHFPIRDAQQYASKVAVGHLKYRATAGWDGDQGFHYTAPFESLLQGGLPSIEHRMLGDSRRYAFAGSDLPGGVVESSIDSPLRYEGGPLTLTAAPDSVLTTTLRLAEAMADELGARAKALLELAALQGRASALASELRSARELNARLAEALERDRVIGAQLAEDNAVIERRASGLELQLLAARELNFVQAKERVATRTLPRRVLWAVAMRLSRAATELRAIRKSPFFDGGFYLASNPDVRAVGMDPARHYLLHGAKEGRDPGPRFRTREYLAGYPDVAVSGMNALAHFELYGRNEGRTAGCS